MERKIALAKNLARAAAATAWALTVAGANVLAQNSGPPANSSFTSAQRLSIADTNAYYYQTATQIEPRFQMFKRLGIGTLRSFVAWYAIEPSPGQEAAPLAWLTQAAKDGFGSKMWVASLSGAPVWFFQQNPGAVLINDAGQPAVGHMISPWFPGIVPILQQENEKQLAWLQKYGLLDGVSSLIVDGGLAGEPIYPVAWTQNSTVSHFWCYGENARQSFITYAEQLYNQDLNAANTSWHTQFQQWQDVTIPLPGTKPGPFWRDVINWYYQSKRAIISAQIASFRSLALKYFPNRQVPIIILLPGGHTTPAEITAAIASGSGDVNVMAAVDTEFLIDSAYQNGCWLQHTDCENVSEVEYIKQYMTLKGYNIPVWGENAGGAPALNPGQLAGVVLGENLFGLEYIDSSALVLADTVTPNQTVYPQYAAALTTLKIGWLSPTAPPPPPPAPPPPPPPSPPRHVSTVEKSVLERPAHQKLVSGHAYRSAGKASSHVLPKQINHVADHAERNGHELRASHAAQKKSTAVVGHSTTSIR
jgi:hypothetical protein